jgi:hypothetical protein
MVTYYIYQNTAFAGHLLDFRVPPEQGDLAIMWTPIPPTASAIRGAKMAPIWALAPGTNAWRIGKPDNWLPAQAPSQYIGPERGIWLKFDGLDAPRGASGAPVVTELGLVGMVVEDIGVIGGARGVGNALPADMIARNVSGWGIIGWDIQLAAPGALSQNPMADPQNITDRVAALLQRDDKSPAGTLAAMVMPDDLYNRGATAAAGTVGGVPNWREAVYWYGLAAKHGNAKAYTQLGLIIVRGLSGSPSDPAGAVTLWLKGALLGDGAAALNLGEAYEKGVGVPIDLAAALSWYGKAVLLKENRATQPLQQLRQRLQ